MTRVAAIDCGTNSIRLLVTDLPEPAPSGGAPSGGAPSSGDRGGRAQVKQDVEREMRIVRLGHGVDRTGRLDDAALARTFQACEDYAKVVRGHGAEAVRFCATSATRDAANAEVFAAGVHDRLGVSPDVLTGEEEAALAFAGAARELAQAAEPVLVVDLGGGSTELILGSSGAPDVAQSLDLGSVRLTERHLHDDPPSPAQVAVCERDVDAALDGCHVDLARARTVVGVAGTFTTLAAHALGLESYDPIRIHHARIPYAQVDAACDAILTATVEQRCALPYMHPGRADVIGGGAVIVRRLLARARSADGTLLVSEHDILDGIAWSLL